MMASPDRLLSALLSMALLTAGCGQPAAVPADVRVLKEGTFTITPEQPFWFAENITRGDVRGQYEFVITVKVTAGDAVQVVTTQEPSDSPKDIPLKRLSMDSPVKEIRLTDKIRVLKDSSSRIRINIKTVGKSSDVSVKITSQYE